MIRLLEEISLGAWPAPAMLIWDGWILRFASAYTRRANSVQPLYDGSQNVEDKIRFCENEYRTRGQRVIFKMTNAARPADLDSILANSGYQEEARTSVQSLCIEQSSTCPSTRVRQWNKADAQCLNAYAQMNDLPQKHHTTLAQIIGAITAPICCGALIENDKPIACGMAVVQDQWVGLFDIVTQKDRRRQGLAGELIGHLLNWSKERGAHKAYLQVMLDNVPAISLYRKMGFTEAYQYWYRVKE